MSEESSFYCLLPIGKPVSFSVSRDGRRLPINDIDITLPFSLERRELYMLWFKNVVWNCFSYSLRLERLYFITYMYDPEKAEKLLENEKEEDARMIRDYVDSLCLSLLESVFWACSIATPKVSKA